MAVFEPHGYQREAIRLIEEKPAVGLFLDMGLGKTACALTAIQNLMYDRFEVRRVLVVAPLRVARSVWPAEVAKWDHLNGLRLSLVLGGGKERTAALSAPADIYVINRENVSWLVDLYRQKWPFDMVVIDELSSFKSSSSRRFRDLRKVRPLIRRMVGLTGTPTSTGLEDLWAQVYLLDRGERLGTTIGRFREKYFRPGRRSGHIVYEWLAKEFSQDAIFEAIGDICFSMRASDWLDLPPRVDNVVDVELSAAETATYRKMERDMLLPFAGADVSASTAGVLSGKLSQLANGAVYDEQGGVREVHTAKLDALEDIVEAANGRQVLVFYWYKHDLARIKARLPQARVLGGDQDISDWNAGRVPVLLVHPASGGHGLNLQTGGSTAVWFGLTWSLELYQQANARLHRQGQTERVVVHHLVARGTVDVDCMRALAGRTATQDALLEAVKARVRGATALPDRG